MAVTSTRLASAGIIMTPHLMPSAAPMSDASTSSITGTELGRWPRTWRSAVM